MKNLTTSWISAEVHARIEPPPIPLVKKGPNKVNEYDTIKIKMLQNLSDTDSETYKLKILTLEHGEPE